MTCSAGDAGGAAGRKKTPAKQRKEADSTLGGAFDASAGSSALDCVCTRAATPACSGPSSRRRVPLENASWPSGCGQAEFLCLLHT